MNNLTLKNFYEHIDGKDVVLTSFNHGNPNAISDQLFFLQEILRGRCNFRFSNELVEADYIVLIEYFDQKTLNKMNEYLLRNKNSKIIVVLTEHIDLIQDQLLFHGKSIHTDNDYMTPADKSLRIEGLLKTRFLVDFYITLFDLPELVGFDRLLPGKKVVRLSGYSIRKIFNQTKPEYDFIFFGKLTDYRKDILEKLIKSYSVRIESKFINEYELADLINKSSVVLNIPQDKDWKWLSIMRCLRSLNLGRPVINFSLTSIGNTNNFVESIAIDDALFYQKLDNHLLQSKKLFEKEVDLFNDGVNAFAYQ
jgi:hypothetical protein